MFDFSDAGCSDNLDIAVMVLQRVESALLFSLREMEVSSETTFAKETMVLC